MSKHEDQFFEMFRESFDGFSPEVPGAVYSGVQKKLFWSTFLGFNASRLNIWYVLLATSAVALMGWSQLDGESYAMMIQQEVESKTDTREAVTVSMNDVFAAQEIENEAVHFSPIRSSSTPSEEVVEATAPIETPCATLADDNHKTTAPAEAMVDAPSQTVVAVETVEAVEATEILLPYNMERSLMIPSDIYTQVNSSSEFLVLDLKVTKPVGEE